MSEPISYYAATLERIQERLEASGLPTSFVSVSLRISMPALESKLSGETMFTVPELRKLAEVLGCPMSAIIA